MQSRLAELHLSGQYLRISGIEVDADEAASRGLKSGEWGVWQGWIRMLDKASQSTASFVHLMEDDLTFLIRFLSFFRTIFCLGFWLGRKLFVRILMSLRGNA